MMGNIQDDLCKFVLIFNSDFERGFQMEIFYFLRRCFLSFIKDF